MQLSEHEIKQANEFESFSRYIHTWDSIQFLNLKERIIALFFGNQRGKGAMVWMGYVHRILGTHPIPERNINYFECANGHTFSPAQWLDGTDLRYKDGLCPKCAKPNRKEVKLHIRSNKIIRVAGDILPGGDGEKGKKGDGSKEVRCVMYKEMMKWMPPLLVHNTPTERKPQVDIYDPYGGEDIVFEYVSYKMPVESTRGHQRVSIAADELGSEGFYDEQRPRLMVENGDFILTYTVTEDSKSTVLYDQIYDKASVYYRSKFMVDEYYKKRMKQDVPQIERTGRLNAAGRSTDIAVMQSASDDNPTLTTRQVEDYLMDYPDPEVQMMRRFCIFTQLSSKIFPQFRFGTHDIDMKAVLEKEMRMVA